MGVLEQTYKTAMDKPLRVLDIFNEFYGEDRVDMQGFPTLAEVEAVLPDNADINAVNRYIDTRIVSNRGFILVHFPHVRITNEFDRYTDANHLYAKVWFDRGGRILGRFALNRSEYTVLHFTNDYMHSHVSSIPVHNFEEFQQPCTGNGPINNTICSLARDFDEDLWRLFCLELDRYMQVESIAGTPYHRLESLTAGGRSSTYIVYNQIRLNNRLGRSLLGYREHQIITFPQLAEFIKYVIDSEVLKFSYQDGRYTIAMSPQEYYIKVSNLFIKWYNKKWKRREILHDSSDLISQGIIGRYRFVNGNIVRESNYRRDYHSYLGARICTFKGQPVTLTVSDAQDESNANDVIILRQEIAEYIFTKIFNTLNFKYGNDEQEGATTNQKVYFL